MIGSEIIGLVPRKAIELSAEYDLQLENFSPAQVLENRLASVAGILLPPPAVPAEPMAALQPLVDTLREAVQELSERVLGRAAGSAAPAPELPSSADPRTPPSPIWEQLSPQPKFMSAWYNSKPWPRRLCC